MRIEARNGLARHRAQEPFCSGHSPRRRRGRSSARGSGWRFPSARSSLMASASILSSPCPPSSTTPGIAPVSSTILDAALPEIDLLLVTTTDIEREVLRRALHPAIRSRRLSRRKQGRCHSRSRAAWAVPRRARRVCDGIGGSLGINGDGGRSRTRRPTQGDLPHRHCLRAQAREAALGRCARRRDHDPLRARPRRGRASAAWAGAQLRVIPLKRLQDPPPRLDGKPRS